VKEQNHLSKHLSVGGILQGIYGLSGDPSVAASGRGRSGVILTGHDHAGCDVYHHITRMDSTEQEMAQGEDGIKSDWKATRWSEGAKFVQDENVNGIREVTVRSMMGEFAGNAALVSAWFDSSIGEKGEWRIEVTNCQMGVQHIWWAVHIYVLVCALLCMTAFTKLLMEEAHMRSHSPSSPAGKREMRQAERRTRIVRKHEPHGNGRIKVAQESGREAS